MSLDAEDQKARGAFQPVFVLGAGFSRAIADCMPTADHLGDQVLGRMRRYSKKAPPDEMTRGRFEEWLSRLAEDQPDLTEFENLERRAHFSLIAAWIASVIEELQKGATRRIPWPPEWLVRFLAVAHAARATVITFNYDTLVEQALNTMFLRGHNAHSWARVRSCDVLDHFPPRVDRAEEEPDGSFRLLKLHGSVNVYWTPGDQSGASIVRWPEPEEDHRADEKAALGMRAMWLDEGPILSPSPHPEDRDAQRERLLRGREPLIVPPTALKGPFYRAPYLRGLWQQARHAIREATDVYLVGYSLPVTDLVTVGLLRENVQPGCGMTVVNAGDGLEEVYERCRTLVACPTGAVMTDPLTIDDWVDELVDRRAREVAKEFAEKLGVLARGTTILPGGTSAPSSDGKVRVVVKRSDHAGYEAAERVEAGVLHLSEQPGRPIELEPGWTTGSLERGAQECLVRDGRISCRFQDGRTGVVIGEQTVRAPQVISAEYEVTLDSVSTD